MKILKIIYCYLLLIFCPFKETFGAFDEKMVQEKIYNILKLEDDEALKLLSSDLENKKKFLMPSLEEKKDFYHPSLGVGIEGSVQEREAGIIRIMARKGDSGIKLFHKFSLRTKGHYQYQLGGAGVFYYKLPYYSKSQIEFWQSFGVSFKNKNYFIPVEIGVDQHPHKNLVLTPYVHFYFLPKDSNKRRGVTFKLKITLNLYD